MALSGTKRLVLAALVLMTVAVLVYGGWMIKHHMDYAITNAVFVDTESITNIGFNRVAGRIVEMTKREGDEVKEGEVLAKIDPTDYRLLVERVRKELAALEKQREALKTTLDRIDPQLHLKVDKAKSAVKAIAGEIDAVFLELKALETQISQIRRDRKRFLSLYEKGAVSKRKYELADTELKIALRKRDALKERIRVLKIKLDAARKDLKLALQDLKRIDETKKKLASLDEKIAALKVQLKDLKRQLDYCTLKSPMVGRVAKKYVNVGDVVAPGIPVYALVDPKDIFILVLLEETKLRGVEPGCPAKIRIDALPDEEYEGVVEKILPTSAAKFALVPRDISAGEFTKVVQRIPVKVRITKGDVDKLVVGMGGEIEIKRRK